MDEKIKTALVILLAAITLALSAATVIAPKKDYSEQENRYLEDRPVLSAENVLDGSFMKNSETYVSDHFILRDVFMTVRAGYERLTGRNCVNGIYLCKDGYYIEEYNGSRNTARITAAVNRLTERVESADIRAVLVPTAVSVYADKLPAAAKGADQETDRQNIMKSINGDSLWVDIAEALQSAKEEQLFYKLDHHWTTYGAYTAYREIIKSFGFTPLERSMFTEREVTAEFKGTFASKVNDLLAEPDTITVFESDRLALTVTYPERNLTTDTLYAPEYLTKKDKYSYFLNNQNAMVEIHNANAQSSRVLAVVKDSYANCLIPFLAEHFETIYVFDTRYYRKKVTEFINRNGVTDVLFLYNMYTIDTDGGINGIQ
ncbi:MAG: hypothetical protein J5845_05360 [Lachnospiraceae bacterium]|nr:hypothetical protein [Lachnospiraceae bacterium]